MHAWVHSFFSTHSRSPQPPIDPHLLGAAASNYTVAKYLHTSKCVCVVTCGVCWMRYAIYRATATHIHIPNLHIYMHIYIYIYMCRDMLPRCDRQTPHLPLWSQGVCTCARKLLQLRGFAVLQVPALSPNASAFHLVELAIVQLIGPRCCCGCMQTLTPWFSLVVVVLAAGETLALWPPLEQLPL